MKNGFLAFLATCLLVLPAYGKDAPTSESQLLKEFEAALKAKDSVALLSLFNSQGVSDEMKAFQKEITEEILAQEVKGVKLLPLAADHPLTNEVDGVRYKPNVSVVGLLEVQFQQDGNATSLPYGNNGKAFYIAGTVEEKIATPDSPSRMLGITVLAPGTGGDSFSGSFIYVNNGKEIKEAISGGNWSKVFRGDYIKSCTIQKTSDEQKWITGWVSEEGKKIFDSGTVESGAPIVYEKK